MAIAATVFRDYETDGVPASGAHKVKKPSVRELLTGYETIINAFTSNGGLIYITKAQMDADLAHAAKSSAWVIADPTFSNNGIYQKLGGSGSGSWLRVADLPYSFIPAADAGAGTANAIVATTPIPVSTSALIILNIFETNTASPVTVSFNGGTPLTIKSNTGTDVAAGGLTAGMNVLGRITGSVFRLLYDQDAAAIVAGAQAAFDAIEAMLGALTPSYSSIDVAETYSLAAYNEVEIRRFTASSKLYPARYKKVVSEPSHILKFQDSVGNWFEIADATVLHPYHAGALGGATDDTVAIQAVLDLAQVRGCRVDLAGVWSVSKITIDNGSAFFEITGNAEINANSVSAQDSLIEIKRGNFSLTGSMAAVCGYRTNYDCGFWVWNAAQLQAVVYNKMIAAGCTVGLKVGHPSYPSAIISENTFEGFRTYGCPEVMHVIGAQTYAMIGNPPAMSADAFGGDAGWAARPKRCIVNVGANTSVTAGEVLQTTSGAATDYVFEMRPILASGELSWGRLKVQGSFIETAGPLCLINNPGGLTGLNTAKDRGRFLCAFADGFVAQDSAPFIKASADFSGDIIVMFPNFWFPGTRSNVNIECLGNLTHVHMIGANFGGGFKAPLAGVSGGILHFDRRVILQAYDLPAVALSSGVLKFQSAVTGGDLARWQSLYSSSTGGVTVPPGGLREVRIFASLKATGITGSLVVKKNGAVVETRPSSVNAFTIEFTELEPAAGAVYTVELSIASGSGSPTTNAGANTMIIEAAR